MSVPELAAYAKNENRYDRASCDPAFQQYLSESAAVNSEESPSVPFNRNTSIKAYNKLQTTMAQQVRPLYGLHGIV